MLTFLFRLHLAFTVTQWLTAIVVYYFMRQSMDPYLLDKDTQQPWLKDPCYITILIDLIICPITILAAMVSHKVTCCHQPFRISWVPPAWCLRFAGLSDNLFILNWGQTIRVCLQILLDITALVPIFMHWSNVNPYQVFDDRTGEFVTVHMPYFACLYMMTSVSIRVTSYLVIRIWLWCISDYFYSLVMEALQEPN